MSDHTKGPWIHSEHGFNVLTADSMRSIAAVHAIHPGHSSEADRREHLANAKLIAAAPELLEALRSFVFMLEPDAKYYENPNVRVAVASAKEAIAKAEGRT